MLVCGAVAFNWFYAPVETNILDTQMKIDELAISRQNAAAIRREHARLSSQLQEIEARYAALEERVPLNAEAGSFLKHVSEIAQRGAAGDQQFPARPVGPRRRLHGDGSDARRQRHVQEHLFVLRSAREDSAALEGERPVAWASTRRPTAIR